VGKHSRRRIILTILRKEEGFHSACKGQREGGRGKVAEKTRKIISKRGNAKDSRRRKRSRRRNLDYLFSTLLFREIYRKVHYSEKGCDNQGGKYERGKKELRRTEGRVMDCNFPSR